MDENEKDELGDRFRALRKKLGMTQKEFAESIGMSQSFIGEIERGGGKEPSRALLVAIARAHHVSLDWLLLGIESPTIQDNGKVKELEAEIQALKKENSKLTADIQQIDVERKKLDVENREITKELVERLRQLVDIQGKRLSVSTN
jgi:transcriptional regulator with XRE-family HTH domain